MPRRFLLLLVGAGLVAALAQPPAVRGADQAPRGKPTQGPNPIRCPCPGGRFDVGLGRCVVDICAVPGMPDGNKGGGYFASRGSLFKECPGLSVTAVVTQESQCDRFGTSLIDVRLDIEGGKGPYTCEGPANGFPVTVPAGPCTGSARMTGTHMFKVTDSTGATQNVTIEIPEAVELLSTEIKPPTCCSCKDGSATVQVRGDNDPLSIRWDDPRTGRLQTGQGATGLAAGTYLVTVTDQEGCYKKFEVKVPAAPGCVSEPTPEEPGDPQNLSGVWRLGTLKIGKVYPTTVTAKNLNCRGRHTFEVSVEGAPWFRITGPSTLSGISPGRSRVTDAEVDLRDAAPGEYRGKVVVRCLTCPPPPKCQQDLTEIDVRVTASP